MKQQKNNAFAGTVSIQNQRIAETRLNENRRQISVQGRQYKHLGGRTMKIVMITGTPVRGCAYQMREIFLNAVKEGSSLKVRAFFS